MKHRNRLTPEGIFVSSDRKQHQEKKSRRCNLCSEFFRPRSVHERFCRSCKERDELLRYSSWMGEVEEELAIKFS